MSENNDIIIRIKGDIEGLKSALSAAKGQVSDFLNTTKVQEKSGWESMGLSRWQDSMYPKQMVDKPMPKWEESMQRWRDIQTGQTTQTPTNISGFGVPSSVIKGIQQASTTYTNLKNNAFGAYNTIKTSSQSAFQTIKSYGTTASGVLGGYGTVLQNASSKMQSLTQNTDEDNEKKKKQVGLFTKLNKGLTQGVGGFGHIFTASKNAGRQMAWFGFRLTMMGRMLQRGLMAPLKQALQLFKNWEKTIEDIGTGMGFLAAQGLLTADAQNMMIDAMTKLPALGMTTQGIMSLLSSLFVKIGADVLPIFAKGIIDLITALGVLWDASKGEVLPILKTFADTIFPKLISLVNDTGKSFMVGLVEGLTEAGKALSWVLDIIKPYMPTIGKIMGLILGLSPIMAGLGIALFAMSVPLQAFGSIMGSLIGPLSNIIALFGPMGWIAAILGVIAALALLTIGFDELGLESNETVKYILEMISGLADDVVKYIQSIDWVAVWTKFIDAVGEVLSWLVPMATNVVNLLGQTLILSLQGFGVAISEYLKTVDWEAAFATLGAFLGSIGYWMLALIGNLTKIFLDIFNAIKWGEVFGALSTFVSGLPTWIFNQLKNPQSEFRTWIASIDWIDVFFSLGEFIGGLIGFLFNLIPTALDLQTQFYEWVSGVDWLMVFAQIGTAIVSAVMGGISGIFDSLPTWLKQILGIENITLPTIESTKDLLPTEVGGNYSPIGKGTSISTGIADVTDDLNSGSEALNNYTKTQTSFNNATTTSNNLLSDYTDGINRLALSSSTVFGHSIGDDIERNMLQARDALIIGSDASRQFNEQLKESIMLMDLYNNSYMTLVGGALGGMTGPTIVGPMTNDITVTFENVTVNSDADIDKLSSEVSRRIADGIEGVLTRIR